MAIQEELLTMSQQMISMLRKELEDDEKKAEYAINSTQSVSIPILRNIIMIVINLIIDEMKKNKGSNIFFFFVEYTKYLGWDCSGRWYG